MLVVKGLAKRKEVGTVDVFVVRGNLCCGCNSAASWISSSRPLGIEINLLDGVPSRDSNHFFTPVITTLDSISFFSS
jgi:hypothetical protein